MMGWIRRREVITLLGGASAWPLVAQAQQPAIPTVGILGAGTAATSAPLMAAFREGLNETGYVEGRNIAIEYRWVEDRNDQLQGLAADLVGRKVAVIAAIASTPAAIAAKMATATIPIVFYTAFDPVKIGLVASLSRPGGNVTGVTSLGAEVGPKRLELMQQLIPTANLAGFLVNPTSSVAEVQARELVTVARTLGLQLHIMRSSSEGDFESAFESLAKRRASALVIGNDGFFYSRRQQLAALAERQGVPTIFPWRDAVVDGGLISYGGKLADAYRQMGVYVSRLVKGETPTELPVQQATKLELVINLKTAKALGLDLPATLLARADEVVE